MGSTNSQKFSLHPSLNGYQLPSIEIEHSYINVCISNVHLAVFCGGDGGGRSKLVPLHYLS